MGVAKNVWLQNIFGTKTTPGGLLNDLPNVSYVMLPLLIVAATVSPVASLREGCFRSGRLVFWRMAPELQPLVKQEKRDVEASTFRVEITVKDSKLAEKLLSGDWAPGTLGEMAKERLSLRGPLSPKTFDNTGTRFLEVALPSKGHWAKWKILECAAIHCGDGGVTWAMALILANMVSTSLPEYPRLRLLELGAGTGLVSSCLQRRGHELVVTDGHDEVLLNLRKNWPKADIRRFRWHVAEDYQVLSQWGSFDLLLGADLLVDARHCDAFRAALRPLLGVSPEVLLMERHRSGARPCAKLIRSDGFWVEERQEEQLTNVVVDSERDPPWLLLEASEAILIRVRREENENGSTEWL